MAFSIHKFARMNEFSMELNSLGHTICVSLNTTHLSQAEKKLAASDVRSLDFVHWLFSEMVRRPVDEVSEDHDPANNPRFTEKELTALTNTELEEFAEKLIDKNKHLLLKTHKGSDVEKSVDESACDFLVRVFRHYAAEQKAQWKRMTESYSENQLMAKALESIRKNSELLEQPSFRHYVIEEKATMARMIGLASNLFPVSTTMEIMQRNFGIADQYAFRHCAEEEKLAATKMIALASQSRNWDKYSDWNRIDRFSTVGEVLSAQTATQQHLAMYSSAAVDEAKRIAELAQTYTLQAALDPFRTAVEPFASKLLHLQALDTIKSPAYLNAFMQASTISDLFVESMRVDRQLQEATRQFLQAPVPAFDTLKVYGQFLSAAGLGLSHWPHLRLLTIGEKRRRFRARLKNKAESSHVIKARTVAQRYELTLRDILDEVMASEYGEDWAIERLPLCNCKDLLGKWKKRGGEVLDHADYAHYERIVSYPAHFEAVFEAGFDDLMELGMLIKKAGSLRAALQHFHKFTPEDLRDLRLIWRTIETGLLALTDNYDFKS